MNNSLLIYGANGYSAQLIIRKLIDRNIVPILAGRNYNGVIEAAQKFNCEYRIFGLDDEAEIISNLKDIHTMLNCAGPFRYTAKPLLEACVKSATNYLDITGEIDAIETAWSYNEQAASTGITIIPSVGFDVITTDCLAKKLWERMPEATSLKLGIQTDGKISKGTWKTTIEMMGETGKIRRDGKIIDSEIGELETEITLGKNLKFKGVSIPWGDVSSAFYSTGIPNIEVYLGLNPVAWKFRNSLNKLKNGLRNKNFNRFVQKMIGAYTYGPSKSKREKTTTIVWGTVSDDEGNHITEAFQTMEGYDLTAEGASESADRVLNDQVTSGTKTPSLAFGSSFMDEYVVKRII
jgi:short subunit dehydrogenase-like uncharacterized protein